MAISALLWYLLNKLVWVAVICTIAIVIGATKEYISRKQVCFLALADRCGCVGLFLFFVLRRPCYAQANRNMAMLQGGFSRRVHSDDEDMLPAGGSLSTIDSLQTTLSQQVAANRGYLHGMMEDSYQRMSKMFSNMRQLAKDKADNALDKMQARMQTRSHTASDAGNDTTSIGEASTDSPSSHKGPTNEDTTQQLTLRRSKSDDSSGSPQVVHHSRRASTQLRRRRRQSATTIDGGSMPHCL